MNSIRCNSCGAHFLPNPASALTLTTCPRCNDPLSGPRRQAIPYQQPALQVFDFHRPVTCSICGCVMTHHERFTGQGTCLYPLCQHKRVAAEMAGRQAQTIAEADAVDREMVEQVHRALETLGIAPETYPDIALLPANTRDLTEMTDERRAAMKTRLLEIVAEIQAAQPTLEATTTNEMNPVPEYLDYVHQGCATCRGECCRNGGDRAYLKRKTLEDLLAKRPGKTLEELVDDYLALIPARTYEGSCIYHGETGCGLTREMRSETCNDFYCNSARTFPSIVGSLESPEVLVAAMNGQQVVRLAVINGRERKDMPNP